MSGSERRMPRYRNQLIALRCVTENIHPRKRWGARSVGSASHPATSASCTTSSADAPSPPRITVAYRVSGGARSEAIVSNAVASPRRARVMRPGTAKICRPGEKGVLEIHDLANVDSCAFIRTEDMALAHPEGFELAGRLPKAGLKGCSLAFE